MDERLLGRDLALHHQLFDVGVIGAAKDQAVAAKMIEAAVAAMRPADLARLQQHITAVLCGSFSLMMRDALISMYALR
jgi:hypothetical protein